MSGGAAVRTCTLFFAGQLSPCHRAVNPLYCAAPGRSDVDDNLDAIQYPRAALHDRMGSRARGGCLPGGELRLSPLTAGAGHASPIWQESRTACVTLPVPCCSPVTRPLAPHAADLRRAEDGQVLVPRIFLVLKHRRELRNLIQKSVVADKIVHVWLV